MLVPLSFPPAPPLPNDEHILHLSRDGVQRGEVNERDRASTRTVLLNYISSGDGVGRSPEEGGEGYRHGG
jgi:hypothetical protein